jgi:hypothetical protein
MVYSVVYLLQTVSEAKQQPQQLHWQLLHAQSAIILSDDSTCVNVKQQ